MRSLPSEHPNDRDPPLDAPAPTHEQM
jgi:hypothetical protein